MFKKFKYLPALITAGVIASLISINATKPSQASLPESITDQNGDGIVNLVDARIIAPPVETDCTVCVDVNGDSKIDEVDLKLVTARIGAELGNPSENAPLYKARLDINGDEHINNDDKLIVEDYIGQNVIAPVFGLEKPWELTYGYKANDIIIDFKPRVNDSKKQAVYNKYQLTKEVSLKLSNAAGVKSASTNVENLQKQIKSEPVVESVTKNLIAELATNDTRWDDQWGHVKINIEQAWYTETTGSNIVRVAVIDTGADYDHEDLQNNLSQEYRRNVIDVGNPFFEFNDTPDEIGHGTHMAGIIGATANNSKAIAGLNWNVEIIPVRACVEDILNGGICDTSWILLALEWLALSGADPDVVNMSFGWPSSYSNSSMEYYIDAMQRIHDTVFVASAGNDGLNNCEYPANYEKVICVGATDQNDQLAVNTSGVADADIFAPGVSIISTVPPDSDYDANGNGVEILNEGNNKGGTSMAAAYISGVAALCKAIAPSNPSRSDLRCDRFLAYDTNGFGRINAWAFLWYRNCDRFDHNNNGVVDLIDIQMLAYRANLPSVYNSNYDVYPVGMDGQINNADTWVQFNRYDAQCN